MDIFQSLIVIPFTNVLLLIYSLVGNFGIAIILFTILTLILTYPLTVKQIKGMTAMQAFQASPRYKEIQQKYKNDKEKLGMETMKLQKEMGVSLGASCLPTLIQFPILIGLYQALQQTIAVSPLSLLHLIRINYGWVNVANIFPINTQFLWMDLGQVDNRLLIPGLTFAIPLMAILVVISTWLSSRLMQAPPDPANPQGNMMSGMMNVYMPIMMGVFAYSVPTGLSLYWVISNLLRVGQYALLGKVNWAMVNPFYKPPKVQVIKGAASSAASNRPAKVQDPPEPSLGSSEKRQLSSGSSRPVSKAAKVKKANYNKPVKSGSSKYK
jgi:YidC/Oxa1 family membrane protein insertase